MLNTRWKKSKFTQFSYFNSSWAEKLLKQLAISTKRLAQEPLLNAQHNGGLRNFVAATRVLKMMSVVVSQCWQWWIKSLSRSQSMHNCSRTCFWIRRNVYDNFQPLERDWKDKKNLIKGCLTIRTTAKRNAVMKCHLPFFYATRMTHFSTGLWLAMKSGFFMTTGSVVRRRQSSTSLPETRVAPKEGHADCLVVCDRSHLLQFFECRRNPYGGEVLPNGWNASETLTTTPSISQQ